MVPCDSQRRQQARSLVMQRMRESTTSFMSRSPDRSGSPPPHPPEPQFTQLCQLPPRQNNEVYQKTEDRSRRLLSSQSNFRSQEFASHSRFKVQQDKNASSEMSPAHDGKEKMLATTSLLSNQFSKLQGKDAYQRDKDVMIVRNLQRMIPVKKLQSQNKNCTRKQMNPFVSVKSQKNKHAKEQNFLSRVNERQEVQYAKRINSLHSKFLAQEQKKDNLDEIELPKKLQASIAMPMMIYNSTKNAELAAKQTLKKIFVKRQNHRIKDSMNRNKKDVNSQMKKIKFQEPGDDIYSQSDASQYREQEMYLSIDNTIQQRLTRQEKQPLSSITISSDSKSSSGSTWSSEEISTNSYNRKSKEKDALFQHRRSDLQHGESSSRYERSEALASKVVKIQNKLHRNETKFFKFTQNDLGQQSPQSIATEEESASHMLKSDVSMDTQREKKQILQRLMTNIKTSFGITADRNNIDLTNLANKYQNMSHVLQEIFKDEKHLENLSTSQVNQIVTSVNKRSNVGLGFMKRRLTTIGSIYQEFNEDINHLHEEEQVSKTQIEMAQNIVKELKFNEIGKHMHKDTIRDMLKNDQMFQYLQAVYQGGEIPLPLVNKVYMNKLILTDYTLDSGHLIGLTDSLKNSTQSDVEEVLLDNCGIDDGELGLLLSGLMCLNKFEIFVYKNNVFLSRGLCALKPILARPDPHNLHELRLVNCVTNPLIVAELIDFLVDEAVHLRSLGLVKMQVKSQILLRISVLVKQSEHLEELDLSWNDLRPQDFSPLLQVLSINRTLVSLNLSCNMIIDKADQNKEFKFNLSSAMNVFVQQRSCAIIEQSTTLKNEPASEKLDYPTQVCNNLGKFIQFNNRVQTIILNNTGLSARVIAGLVPFLRHAKSLICLHMASNPGINKQMQQYYRNRLSILPETSLKVQVEPQELGPLSKQDVQNMSLSQIETHKYKLKNYNQLKLEEVNNYLINRRLRPLLIRQDAELHTDAANITLTRVLGHQRRIAGSGRWRMQTLQEKDNCWVCHKWSYSLFFWREDIGVQNSFKNISIDMPTQKRLVDTIRLHNENCSYMELGEVPVMFCNSTNWKPQPFMKMMDFLDSVSDREGLDYAQLALEDAMGEFNFVRLESEPLPLQRQIKAYIEKRRVQLRSEYVKTTLANSELILKNYLRYKHPNMVNAEEFTSGFTEDTWVLPIFIKPGKNDFLIRSPEDQKIAKRVAKGKHIDDLLGYQTQADAAFKFYYHRKIIKIREERVPNFTKKLKVNDHAGQFKKELSVFADFKDDNQKLLREAITSDFKQWKVKRIVSNYDTANRVESIVRHYYSELKEVFMSTISEKGFSNFRRTHLLDFFENAGVTDKIYLHSGLIDTLIKSACYKEIQNKMDQTVNNDHALCRYQFLEILVRVAKIKSFDDEREINIASTLQALIVNHVLPMKNKLIDIDSFRVDYLWCHEVSDLLEINSRGLEKLYDMIAKSEFFRLKNRLETVNKVFPSIDQVRLVITGANILNLPEPAILHAFYLSKQTVVSEVEQAHYEYTYLHWPEFLEFTARLAQQKYLNTFQDAQWPLQKKLSVILNELLKIVGEERLDPPELREVISDSDDEY